MASLPDGPLPPGPWAEQPLFGNSTLTGRDHPETSFYAARLTLPRAGSRRHEVLKAIALSNTGGRTDHELHLQLGINLNTVRPRRKELQDDGWIEDSGLRRPTETGAPSIVWRVTQRGYDRWLA